jgi:hypothetical protein
MGFGYPRRFQHARKKFRTIRELVDEACPDEQRFLHGAEVCDNSGRYIDFMIRTTQAATQNSVYPIEDRIALLLLHLCSEGPLFFFVWHTL